MMDKDCQAPCQHIIDFLSDWVKEKAAASAEFDGKRKANQVGRFLLNAKPILLLFFFVHQYVSIVNQTDCFYHVGIQIKLLDESMTGK